MAEYLLVGKCFFLCSIFDQILSTLEEIDVKSFLNDYVKINSVCTNVIFAT